MKIGDLARQLGVSVEAIRYYEREGLLRQAQRTGGNYRTYSSADRERLAFILNCRALDMAHDEIRTLLRFRDDPAADCGDVTTLLGEHLAHVRKRLDELNGLERHLRELQALCQRRNIAADCGILHGLEAPSASATARAHVAGSHKRGRR